MSSIIPTKGQEIKGQSRYHMEKYNTTGSGMEENVRSQSTGFGSEINEIEEERLSEIFETDNYDDRLSTIKEEVSGSLFSFDFNNTGNVVYVAIGKSEETSMDALLWTISHVVDRSSAVVFLIHVFPEIKQVPTPLGMMPIDQVNSTQREGHLSQEMGKRRDYLQKFMNLCSISKVNVDTILIESNTEAKAILDLVTILNIRKLVLGTGKRSIRGKKVSGTIGQILKDVPEECEIKIICENKEMMDLITTEPHFSPRAGSVTSSFTSHQHLEQHIQNNNSSSAFSCASCFKQPKVDI